MRSNLVYSLALALALALGGATSATATPPANRQYANPIIWADYSDPDVIRVGDRYYMVSSSFHLSPGIPVLESADLVSWRIIGHVLPRLPFDPAYDMPGPHTLTDGISKPIGGTRYASGTWAPSIRHHAGKFFVYVATPDEGIFMMTATDPRGPWSAPIQVIAGPGLEDPCPFWDDDGSAWLIHGRVGAGPLILHRMSADGTRVLDQGIVVAEDRQRLPVLEGPKLYKRDGYYYIFAPIGGVSTGPQAVGRSRRITGPYEWRDVLLPTAEVKGPHQGGYVETPSGQGWFVHFNSTGAFGRITWLEPVRWEDGWPLMGDASNRPVASAAAPDVPASSPRFALQASDEFSGRRLGLQWQWNHNPDDRRWSLADRPGWLRLSAGHARYLTHARNTLTQMLTGPHMVATARIDLRRMADGQRAGLTMFGVRPTWIGAVREGGVTRLAFASEGVETLGEPLPATALFRVEVGPDQRAHYSWSADGRRFSPIGKALQLAPFSWWRGSRPGLFTFTHAASPAGSIDVDWVRISSRKEKK
ncbi:glycoside hydrolase 43 family protein [Blastomonas sp. AAP25]|uniref:glycoside hydrolase family 43 protein n=1 Tax=Blastomonas sp. AAP25 TaxID=1523416 RepID=UPI0006BA0831|nr:glycoside hydrolase 43 family protein [Blastomonas sp. AAP25]